MLYKYKAWQVWPFPVNRAPTVFDAGGTACPQSYVALDKWSQAYFESGRGEVRSGVPVPNSNADFVVGRPLPTPLEGVVGRYRKTGGGKYKEFQALRESGAIVLRPLDQMDMVYTTQPVAIGVGTPSSYSLSSPLSEGFRGNSATRNPCNGYDQPGMIQATTLNYMSCEPVRVQDGTKPFTPSRSYDVYQDYYYFEPTPEDVTLLWSAINDVLQSDWDTGLITAVSAEANAGVLDLYTNIMESRETFSWILSILSEAAKTYRNTRRAVTRLLQKKRHSTATEAAAIQTEINSRWMEFRYAVSPLMYTIDDTLKYLQEFFSPYQSFRSGSGVPQKLEIGDWSCDLEVIDRVFLKHRYTHDAWNHQLGTSPAVTAWELVPLSFLVDWFVNIGDLLSSLSVPSHVMEQNALYSRQIRLDSNIVWRHRSGASVTFTGGYYKAVPFDPLLRVGVTAGFDMNWKRWLDAFALSWSSVRSLFKT